MTDKVITIKNLIPNICKILNEVITSGEEIVITKHGKPSIVITKYQETSEKVITSLPKQEKVITKLKQNIEKVITNPKEEPKVITKVITSQFCFRCLQAGFKRPAVGEFEILTVVGEKEVFLCAEHKKRLVNA